ncbi:MAG: DUF1445 domain-containing protein [Burkholderiales bacterium]|nr:DUF1445 domain-containing protein [Burkholderiales bacterium]
MLERATPRAVREHIRAGRWRGHTKRLAIGFHQANVIIVRREHAFDFMRFCMRNRTALPLLDVTDPGSPAPERAAPGADLRTDVGDYSIFRNGRFAERVPDLNALWRTDHVAFLTGCSISLARPLQEAGVDLPHVSKDAAPAPAMFITNRQCTPAGIFFGPLVVGMKVVPNETVVAMTAVTSRHPDCHGAPVHIGDPAALGIDNIEAPDWGKAKAPPPGHTAMFWACGLTAQTAAMAAGIPEMITQTVGRMFVTDLPVLAAL